MKISTESKSLLRVYHPRTGNFIGCVDLEALADKLLGEAIDNLITSDGWKV